MDEFYDAGVELATKPLSDNLIKSESAYAALLAGDDPIANYQRAVSEYQTMGYSNFVNSVKSAVAIDEDLSRKAAMTAILEDQTLSTDQKKTAMVYYAQQKEVLPSLREKYVEKVAAVNPNTVEDPDKFVASFMTKEWAIKEQQKISTALSAELGGEATDFVASLAVYLLPWVGGGQQLRQGQASAEVLDAIRNKKSGTLEKLWNTLAIGNTKEKARKILDSMPPEEQVQAIRRAASIIEKTPNLDFDTYILVKDLLDPTSEYGNLEKWLDNGSVALSFVFGGLATKAAIRSKTSVSVVPAASVVGSTAAHNPTVASTMVDKVIKEEVPADALGVTRAETIASILPKSDVDLTSGITPEATKTLTYLDQALANAMEQSSNNLLLYTQEAKDTVANNIRNLVSSAKNMQINLGKSSVTHVEELGTEYEAGFKGSAVFGKTGSDPFTSYTEAVNVAEKFKKQAGEGNVEIVQLADDGSLIPLSGKVNKNLVDIGEYYVRWNWDHKYNPLDALLYGPDAVRVKFDLFGKEIKPVSEFLTWTAKNISNRGLFAHQALPTAVTNSALRAFDISVEMERPFMTSLLKHVSKLPEKSRNTLDNVLKEGEDKVVFSFGDVRNKALAAGHTTKEANKIAEAYLVYRRVGDSMYALLNRSARGRMLSDGVKQYNVGTGSLVGTEVYRNNLSSGRVYDQSIDAVIDVSIKDLDTLYDGGGSLIRLHRNIRNGDEIVQYAIARKGFKEEQLDDFVIPYIKGYVPRFYEDAYFTVRTPKEVVVNGKKITDKDSLRNYSTVVAAGRTKTEVDSIAKELSSKDTSANYSWKRERQNENTLFDDYNLYRQSIIHSRQRGEKVLDNAQRLDPLVSMFNLVQSTSKYAAMEEFWTANREAWVKSYGQFAGNTFPATRKEIQPLKNMTGDEADLYRQAVQTYDYLESLLPMMKSDQEFWKNSLFGLAEVAEKLSIPLANALRALGKAAHPFESLRRIATTFFIYLRPNRQILVQPSQVALLLAMDAKYINPIEVYKFGTRTSTLAAAGMLYKTDTLMSKHLPDDAVLAMGAKFYGTSVKEYKTILEDLQASGLLSSVDSHSVIEGILTSHSTKLTETGLEKFGRRISTAAKALPELGKRVGFDMGERWNLVGSWLVARDRWLKLNPGKSPSTKLAKEQIAADAREMSYAMNRAGTFSYQRNILATPLQFLAVPHKAVLSITTSKLWTPQEKARLMAGSFVLYGAYGVGLVSAVDWLKEQKPDALDEDGWQALKGGLVDWGTNSLVNLLLDDKNENTNIAFSQSFSPLSGGLNPFGEFLTALQEKDFAAVIAGPSWSIVDLEKGRLAKAYRDIATMFDVDKEFTQENIQAALVRASEVASLGTDYMKFEYAYRTGLLVASNQYPIAKATRSETLAKLFGFQTTTELETWETIKQFSDIEKEQKDEAKFLFDSLYRLQERYDRTDPEYKNEMQKIQAYLQVMSQTKPDVYINFRKHYKEFNRQSLQSAQDSVELRMYRNAFKHMGEDREQLMMLLRSSDNPQTKQLGEALNVMTNTEEWN